MGKIVEFFLDRPLLVNIIVITVIGLGIINAFKSQKEGFPEISLNQIHIITVYPGASARDVEINVTASIEEALEEVDGIKEITSVSEEGISSIIVKANENATDADFQDLYTEVDNALSKIDDLPNDIESKPTINKFTSKDIPVLEVSFSGTYESLKKYIPYIENKIKKVSGVASIDVIGLPDEEIHILVDPIKAKKKMVGLTTISYAIKKRNLEGSGGTLESFIGEKKIVSFNKFKEFKDVLETNVVMSSEGYGVKLKEIATCAITPKDMKLLVRNNGKRGVVLVIKKNAKSDIVKTVEAVKRTLKKFQPPKEISSKITVDQSDFTKSRLEILIGNSFIGFILVTILLFLIFNRKTAIWTAFGIPFTLLGMIIFLKLNNITLNIISLGGFIIVLGMLVDDAIVIAEEINSNKEKGMEPKQAAIEAVKTMWIPVTGACLTTMVAFSPILSIGGFPGKFVWVIPVMVIVALAISLFESFFILPAHLYHGKAVKQTKKKLVIYLENKYRKILEKTIKFKYISVSTLLIILFLSIIIMNIAVKKDPFPQESAETFFIKVTLPKGTNIVKSKKQLQKIEDILLKLPQNELKGFSTRIGTQSELSSTERGTQSNLAIIFVYLTKYAKRSRTAEDIMKDLRPKVAKVIPKTTEAAFTLKRFGPPLGRDFEIRISSHNDMNREKTEKAIRKYLSTVKGIHDIQNDNIEGKDELNLVLNHDLLSRTGLTVEDILMTLRIAYDGVIVTDITRNNKKIDFRLRLNQKGRADISYIRQLPILNKQGYMINIKEFVSLKKQKAQAQIHHLDGKRTTTLYGNTDKKIIAPEKVMNLVKQKFKSTANVDITYSGQPVESNKIFSDLFIAAIAALIGVYLIISLIFNSMTKPIIIILTIPFGVIGIVIALLTHSIPMSMFAGVAMVGLIGVIVNDSIVMVHTISHETDKGLNIEGIIKGAVSRLRPILLTTVTTFIGVIPTGYGIGGYDPFLSHMCISLGYGLVFATFSLLIFVPVAYSIWMDVSGKLKKA